MLKLIYLVCFQTDLIIRTLCTSGINQNMVKPDFYGLIALKLLLKLMCSCTYLIHTVSVLLLDQNVPLSTRQSVMSERSGGTPPYQSSPRTSLSHSYHRLSLYHSHNTLPQEGERLSFTLEDTFRELDEFQEDPPLFLEENSWEGEDSDHSDPTLTLLNCEHFQVSRVTV